MAFLMFIIGLLTIVTWQGLAYSKPNPQTKEIHHVSDQHKHGFTCPNGFIRYHRSCYKLSDMHATWLQARGYCNAMGGGLVTIETEEEQKFLINIIKKHKLSYPRSFWTGGNDLAMEGEWHWVATFQRIIYKNWYPKQPDNSRGREHCLEMERTFNYRWNDQPCHLRNHFICEMYMI